MFIFSEIESTATTPKESLSVKQQWAEHLELGTEEEEVSNNEEQEKTSEDDELENKGLVKILRSWRATHSAAEVPIEVLRI